MDFQLTEEQRRMVVSVRNLAQGEFKTDAPKYMDGTFPWTNMKKLADIGVLDDGFHGTSSHGTMIWLADSLSSAG